MSAQLVQLKPADESIGAMRLARADACLIAVPLRQPMKMSGETITHAHNLLIRLEASDGTVGWGEASSAPNERRSPSAIRICSTTRSTPVTASVTGCST